MNNYCRTERVVDGMLSRGAASQSGVVYDCAECGEQVIEKGFRPEKESWGGEGWQTDVEQCGRWRWLTRF